MLYIYSHKNDNVFSSITDNDRITSNTALYDQIQKAKHQQNSYKNTLRTKITYPSIQEYRINRSNYPVYKSLLSIIEAWNPDDPDPPEQFEETLQHFNYSNQVERQLAEQYRNAELPFKLYNIPG